MLSSQAPSTWYSTATALIALETSLMKIAHRARLSAELAKLGVASGFGADVSVGRLSHSVDYADYREKALDKLKLVGAQRGEMIRFGDGSTEQWETAMFSLKVFWALRSLIGPVVESAIILDRYAFLVEQLVGKKEGDRRSVELVALFDQNAEFNSLRNMALVVR